MDKIITVQLSGIEKPIILNENKLERLNLIKDRKFYLYTHEGRDLMVCVALTHRPISLGRFLLGITDPKIYIDHKNHNQYDFTDDNLRLANPTESTRNRRKQRTYFGRDCRSRYKGVSKVKRGRWKSTIYVDKKQIYLGHFDIEEQAALAYNSAAFQYHKEFACLNDFSHLVL